MIEHGEEIAGFQVLSLLAEGGMGIVYQALRLSDGRATAFKVLRDEIRQRRQDVGRFIREAVISQRLHHPNLVDFFDFGFEPRVHFYLATELLQGQELEAYLRERGERLPLKQALDIGLQVCAGLESAHHSGIIHRDLKPSNIFLERQADGKEVVKVFDFGIGKVLDQEIGGKLTQHGISVGTPLYMAPEQIRGPVSSVGIATDIYALGIIIFQLVTGKLPFSGDNPYMIMAAHLKDPPPQLRKLRRELAGTDLEMLLQEMMAKETVDRPATLSDVRERLWEARQLLAPDDYTSTMMELPDISKLLELSGLHETSPDVLAADSDAHTDTDVSAPQEQPIGVLLLHEGEGAREVAWLLPGERLQIGAQKELSLSLSAAGVMPVHAEVYCAPDGWITISSLEGAVVRVNGSATTSSLLQDGDWITLGHAELRLSCFLR
ncbi:MAG: protein kinase [Myxococcales bacterium]|nr:protein kinase [Myxococcales bacterium]MCB9644275.1 protein kinase [Myxococcales bacterium]